MLADRDWTDAEASLRRGAGLAGGSAEPHAHLALFLGALGRFDEALSESARALELDPLGPAARFTLGWILYKAGRHAESSRALEEFLTLHPGFALVSVYLGLNAALAGRREEAAREALGAIEAMPEDHEVLALGIAALGRAGHAGRVEEPLARLTRIAGERYVDPWAVGVAYAGLGRHDEALRWLRRMYDERSPSAFCIRRDPLLDPLREDPRFLEISRRLGFPPADPPART
jgi:tetratricopeptide (TPR) repeat protein